MTMKPYKFQQSGSPIFEHEPRDQRLTLPKEYPDHQILENHFASQIGPVDLVLHETTSHLVHIDILVSFATKDRPFHVLMTTGVSDRRMATPDPSLKDFDRIELAIALPASWPLDFESFRDENHYWPIRLLKSTGRFPHQYETWLFLGHTVPSGDPPERFANTGFTGILLSPPYMLPSEHAQVQDPRGGEIHILSLTPLYPEEMELKFKKGARFLEALFEEKQVDIAIDPRRPSVA
jgi:hypothetical protein